jgi:hypothetical protein
MRAWDEDGIGNGTVKVPQKVEAAAERVTGAAPALVGESTVVCLSAGGLKGSCMSVSGWDLMEVDAEWRRSA